MELDISIIIVNFNTRVLTSNCIESIFQETKGISYEIIVVDNASTDGSKEYFEKDIRIKYIYSPINLGFGRANNVGYKIAIGKYLFLLNSDTILKNNAIKIFYQYMEATGEDVACCGGWLLDEYNNVTHSCGKLPTLCSSFYYYNISPFLRRLRLESIFQLAEDTKVNSEDALDVGYITGADIFMPKTIADRFGLFDEDFFLYYEETEMQFRYARYGYKRKIIKGPQIVHLCGKSHSDDRTYLHKQLIVVKSLFVYMRKCFNRSLCSFYFPIFKFCHIILVLLLGQKWEYKKQYITEFYRL